ncbi:AtpZ/AtpI family protein [Spirosoma sp. SC4-14]|uniref:AtpZ/AtpI family protein n=1 Tax=Spirosoma sp. SC4-14 TaxID=3128900 RepID=UPI0030D457F6
MKNADKQSSFAQEVDGKAQRKARAKGQSANRIWAGLGLFGIIGWSVVVPTLLGAIVGRWLDVHYPAKYAWTLTFLVAGLLMGCLNAWYWVSKENDEINRLNNHKDE